MSTSGTTRVVEVDGPELRSYDLAPEDVGLPRAALEDFAGGTPERNAETARHIFAGEPGAARATSPRSTPAPRSTPQVAPTPSSRACAPPRRRSTPAPPQLLWSAWWR